MMMKDFLHEKNILYNETIRRCDKNRRIVAGNESLKRAVGNEHLHTNTL